MDNSVSRKTESKTPKSPETHSIFLSVVFAVYLALWVNSLDKYIVDGSTVRLAIPFFPKNIYPVLRPSDSLVRPGFIDLVLPGFIDLSSFVVFLLLLVALWWWYVIFLPPLGPRTRFSHYLHDYSTLGAFAIGFQFWGTVDVFLITLSISGFLTGIRLNSVVKHFSKKKKMANKNLGNSIRRLQRYLFWGVGGLTLATIILASLLIGINLGDSTSPASTTSPSKESFNYVSIAQLVGIVLIGFGVYWTWRIAKIVEGGDGKNSA